MRVLIDAKKRSVDVRQACDCNVLTKECDSAACGCNAMCHPDFANATRISVQHGEKEKEV